jgi:hypothetical protein
MDFDVYCDESHPDLLISLRSSARYMVIGSVWLKTESREVFKSEIKSLKNKHLVGGEFKWGKVSQSRQNFYEEILKWFLEKNHDLRFHAIVIDREQVNLLHYHENDQELGFYKFYYQLLHHWISDFNCYHVFCDLKVNRRRDRLHVLKKCLCQSNLSASIASVQAIRSSESVLIQLAGFLTGLVSAKYNHSCMANSFKYALIQKCEKLIGKPIGATGPSETKFNIFEINLKGGWR